ncbi:MAG TPA: site-specific integrase [Bacteroidia bacterium]|nr:site-specific integrase [Bacteroidia bacterium]
MHQVYIRITQNATHKRIRVDNVAVKKTEWAGKYGAWVNTKNKNHVKLNFTIEGKLRACKNEFLDLEKRSPVVSKEQVYRAFVKDTISKNFIEYWDLKTSLKTMPEYNQRKGYDTTRAKILKFAGTEKIDFREINQDWLQEFETSLNDDGLSDSSIHTQQKRIRAIWNKAIDVDKIIEKGLYPFGKGGYKMPQIKEGTIERLEVDEIKEIMKLKYNSENQIFYAQKGFLLSFNCAGIRAEDLLTLKWSNVKNGRLNFNMKKGVTNGRLVSIKITEKLETLLDSIKTGKLKYDDYILPFLRSGVEKLSNEEYKKEIGSKTALLNKLLKKVAEDACIDKALTSHIARHSWAGYAYNETKDIKFVQERMNHKNTKITEGYIGRLGISASDGKMMALEL